MRTHDTHTCGRVEPKIRKGLELQTEPFSVYIQPSSFSDYSTQDLCVTIPIPSFSQPIYSRMIFIVRTIMAYHFLLDSDVPLAFRYAIYRFCLFSFPFLEEGNSRHECIPSSLSEKITENSL